MDEVELLHFYSTVVYHAIMQGNGNNSTFLFDEEMLDKHTLLNADEEEKNKYTNTMFGECCAKNLLHTDSKLTPLFTEISAHLKLYLNGVFNVSLDLFDLYFVKSWYNILQPSDFSGFRKRESSDISFVYFPEVHDDTHYFWVSNTDKEINHLNEFFPGLFSENRKGIKYLNNYDFLTTPISSAKPQTGSIMLYPSKMPTGLFNMKETTSNQRSIILQGEVKLILKPNVLHLEDGLLSINHWRKFNS